jgi:hypothetical protein
MVIGRRSLLVAGATIPTAAYGQCVINAPAVDACRGGVRNAGPAGATLDLNFMFPGSLDPRITFSRASTATYTDIAGVTQTAAVNQPRWDYDPVTHALRGLLIEGASAPRAADIMTMPTAGWFSATAGTIVTEALLPPPNTGFRGIFDLDGGAFNIWLRAYTNGGTADITGNVDTTPLTFGTMTPGTPFKIAATYSAAGTRVAFNGVMGTGTATVSTPATYTTLRLGVTDSGNNNAANGHIRRVQYWPRVLSDAELQAVTT